MNDDAIAKMRADAAMAHTFLHKNIEVKPTGRYATKTVGKDGGRRSQRTLIVHEITPVDPEISWKEWVNLEELFKVETEG